MHCSSCHSSPGCATRGPSSELSAVPSPAVGTAFQQSWTNGRCALSGTLSWDQVAAVLEIHIAAVTSLAPAAVSLLELLLTDAAAADEVRRYAAAARRSPLTRFQAPPTAAFGRGPTDTKAGTAPAAPLGPCCNGAVDRFARAAFAASQLGSAPGTAAGRHVCTAPCGNV